MRLSLQIKRLLTYYLLQNTQNDCYRGSKHFEYSARGKIGNFIVMANPFRPSVCHAPVLCQNEGTQRGVVFTFG